MRSPGERSFWDTMPAVGDFSDPTFVKVARRAGVACAGAAVVVGAAVLIGWQIGSQTLTSIVPGLVAMNPVTALGFIALGAALLMRAEGGAGPRRWIPLGLALVVGGFGLIRLAGYLLGQEMSIDRWLFASRLDLGGQPNRMAPNTAINFAVIGAAVGSLMLGRPRLAHVLTLVVALTSFVTLLGYAYSAAALVRVATFIPMALHTALLFLAMAAAVLCAMPATGLMAALTSRSPGGRVMRGMMPLLVVAPPLLGWLRLQGELAGLYGPAFGVAYTIGAMVITAMILTWTTARALDRSEVERQRVDKVVFQLAHFDTLTGLPNRMLFEDRLRQALARARRATGTVGILFLDLDGFKAVNDTLGHEAGDRVLAEAARRIEGSLRSVDTAARLGGDEFTVVLEELRSAADVQVVARRLLVALNQTYAVAGTEVALSVSVGVSVFPGDSETPAELVAFADAAMYRAKRAGKNQVVVHARGPALASPRP